MKLGENNQAILLLSMRFGEASRGEPTPLTPTEYGRFSRWLHENSFEPRDLFSRPSEVLDGWGQPKGKVTRERLEYLLGRGGAMGLALEKWASAGVWVVTRADPEYPKRLRRKLGDVAPAALLGVGSQRLLSAGGLAIVGSRKVDEQETAFTRQVAGSAARSGMNVVSGGARGVDEAAMLGALTAEGTAIGVLANGLLAAALSGKWRPHLKRADLCLVSTFYPEAPFQVGNAMGRNKYIYALADTALIVRSEEGKGGTWAGAVEALKKGLSPVFVRGNSTASGNAVLQGMGATELPPPPDSLDETGEWLRRALAIGADSTPAKETGEAVPSPEASAPPAEAEEDIFFRYFIQTVEKLLAGRSEVTLKQLKEWHPDLLPKQVQSWLARAVEEGVLERPSRAHRYVLGSDSDVQQSLFHDDGADAE